MNTENVESLSYKFQRLREGIRQAIARGELTGKLPGERVLAKRFQVNAKTLSKALTDLAAEGLLDRSIGRGTYVKGEGLASTPVAGRWLVLADESVAPEIITALRAKNESIHVMTDPVDHIRPSFINQFSAVIDLASSTPDSFLRDLVVRNISVIVVGHEPKTYSMNAVMVDAQLGASRLARELLLAGHRQFVVAADRGELDFVQAVRQTVARFEFGATVDAVFGHEVAMAVQAGATAAICSSTRLARQAILSMSATAQTATIVAVGVSDTDTPCGGYFVSPAQIAQAVSELLSPSQSARPSVLWLAGEFAAAENADVPADVRMAARPAFSRMDAVSFTEA